MRALLLVNPRAGKGRAPALARAVAAGLARRGIDASITVTAAAGEVARLAAEAVGVHDIVAAVGGDGTLNEAARGLLAIHSDRPRPALGCSSPPAPATQPAAVSSCRGGALLFHTRGTTEWLSERVLSVPWWRVL